MSDLLAVSGARIFDGQDWHDDAALLLELGQVSGITRAADIPAHAEIVRLDGGAIVPGFVDLQVNGGGGALLNEVPTLDGIRAICAAHARYGTTALLPTLITDTPEITDRALDAGIAATEARVPGFLGMHFEGPHLSLARKGAHDPALIRPIDERDMARFAKAAEALPNLLVTFAAETVPADRIAAVAALGAIVSIGHSDASMALVRSAAEAGATMATHLFNAMSQLGNREPGVVGAALETGTMHAGLIADGIHVDPASIAIALRAKRGPARIFLVTDAMSTIGTEMTQFTLNGREILRSNGALRLSDGTLAGADLTMIDAILYMHRVIGLPFDEALRMASLYPAQALGRADTHGHLAPGAVADFVHLGADHAVRSTWIGGRKVFAA